MRMWNNLGESAVTRRMLVILEAHGPCAPLPIAIVLSLVLNGVYLWETISVVGGKPTFARSSWNPRLECASPNMASSFPNCHMTNISTSRRKAAGEF